jgi:hypothetical protein
MIKRAKQQAPKQFETLLDESKSNENGRTSLLQVTRTWLPDTA